MKQLIHFLCCTALLLCITIAASAQVSLRLNQPSREQNNVSSARQFIAGRTCTGCKLWIDEDSIQVYATGTFAIKRDLKPGKTIYTLRAEDPNGKTYTKTIYYYFSPPPKPVPTPIFRIDYMNITPKGNLQLSEGDTLHIKVKAYPGCKGYWLNDVPLIEVPAAKDGGIAGIYAGSYVITAADSMLNGRIKVTLRNRDGGVAVMESPNRYSFMKNTYPFIGRTIDNMTYLTATPEGDRLGPDKIGYLDKDVILPISGKEGDYYKIKLSAHHTAYIPEPLVDTATLFEHPPVSIISNARVWGDEKYDYLSVELSDRLPYTSTQEVQPGKIIVDVYGAYSEPGINPVLQGVQEISQVSWLQIEPDVFRMTVSLKHAMPWGYQLYYEGNRLVIKIKRQLPVLALNKMVIGLDAGHGGSNVGAQGLTGASEKQLTLLLSMELKAALEREGARVITTRTTDKFVANEDRLSNFRRINPDLLLSVHLNSSVNPVDISGTATYYKQPFCDPLSAAIHKRLVETGLRDFGNIPGFNFILNNPTEFPGTLIETLFLSNPEDEMRILDSNFRQQMVQKIVQGMKDFLEQAREERLIREE